MKEVHHTSRADAAATLFFQTFWLALACYCCHISDFNTVPASIEDRVFYFSKAPFRGSSIGIFRGGSSIRAGLKNKLMPNF